MKTFRRYFQIPRAMVEVVSSKQVTSIGTVLIYAVIYFSLGAIGLLAAPAVSIFEFPYVDGLLLAVSILLVPAVGKLIHRINPKYSAVLTLASWLVISFTGLALAEILLSVISGLPIPQRNLDNFWVDAVSSTVNLASYSIVITAVWQYRQAGKALSKELARLESFRDGLRAKIQELRERYATEVRDQILPILAELTAALRQSDATKLAQRARMAIEEQVLPLNQRIAGQNLGAELPVQVAGKLKLQDISGYRFILASLFSPAITGILFFASLLPPFIYFYGNAGLIPGVITGVTLLMLVLVFQLLFIATNLNPFLSLLAIGVLSVLISAGSIWVGSASLEVVEIDVQLYLSLGIAIMLFAFGVFQVAMGIGSANLQSLEKANAEYATLLQTQTAEVNAFKMQLSETIHGDVQGKLRAVLLRVKNGGLEGNLEPIIADINYIETTIAQMGTTRSFALSDELEALQEFWSGISIIKMHISDEANDILEHDSTLSQSVYRVTAEAVSNAIKHAEAKSLRISIDTEAESIRVLVMNPENSAAPKPVSTGSGSDLFRQLCQRWSVNTADGETTFTGLLASAKK